MLQKSLTDAPSLDEQGGQSLSLASLYSVVKRRWLAFTVPFAVIATLGATVVMIWPATYLAEGKILVESQQIPTDLVRPTVSTLASERIQVIEQRIMTRDNLLSIASKYGLSQGWKERLSGTEIVDFMRRRSEIKPLELKIAARERGRQAIAFTIGFEYENPVIATRVANEFMTMILNEDVRTRTNFAAETTGFLDHESRRLEGDLSALELKIAELKRREALNLPTNEVSPAEAQLAALKAELVQKSSLFSASHPDIKSLKLRIAALETTMGSSSVKTEKQDVGIEALTRQEEALQKQLETTNQKLATARMGEKLERGQQSERLEVIEQPSLPQKPASPNRPKFMAIVLAAAAACGGVLVFLLESLDGTIRRTADLGGLLPSDLLVTIPYIATTAEVRRQTTHRRIAIALTVIVTVVAIGIAAVLLPVEQWWNGFLSRVSS